MPDLAKPDLRVPLDDGDVPPDEAAAPVSRTLGRIPALVWVLVGSTIAIRLAFLLLLGDPANPGAMEHGSLATSLNLGQGFAFNESGGYTQYGRYEPSSVQSPPYPLFLAALYWLFDAAPTPVYVVGTLVNVLFAAATVPALYLLVRRLARGDGRPRRAHLAGVVACGLFAIWPTQVFAVGQLQAVVAITLSFVVVALLWLASLDTGKLAPWLGYGVVGCLAALTEPVLLPPLALSGVWVLFTRKLPWDLRLRNGVVLLACAIFIIGPWTWRNYKVHGAFMPIKSTFWVNVWKGNNANDDGHSGTDRPELTAERLAQVQATGRDELRQYDLLPDARRVELDGKGPVERERVFARMAKEWIRENPDQYALVSLKRLAKTLWWDWDHPGGYRALYAYPVSRAVLLLGTLLGLVAAWRARWRLSYLGLVAGLVVLTYTLTVTAARFGMPLEPYQFALIGLLVAGIVVRGEPVERRSKAVLKYLGSRGLNTGA